MVMHLFFHGGSVDSGGYDNTDDNGAFCPPYAGGVGLASHGGCEETRMLSRLALVGCEQIDTEGPRSNPRSRDRDEPFAGSERIGDDGSVAGRLAVSVGGGSAKTLHDCFAERLLTPMCVPQEVLSALTYFQGMVQRELEKLDGMT